MSEKVLEKPQTDGKVKDITITGLLIAMVFVATKFINIRLPISVNGGLIHTGTVMLIVASIVFGSKKGALAGAFGMGLFDLLSGWVMWAPFTFIVRAIMGYIIGTVSHAKDRNGYSLLYNLIAIALGSVWMITGYYITEIILYGNWIAPATSIPGNLAQIVLGLVFGLPIISALKKFKFY